MSSGLKGELLTGVFPVLQLPFDDEDRLDMDAPAAEVEFCVRAGDRAGARKTFNRLLPLINQSVLLETPLVKEVLGLTHIPITEGDQWRALEWKLQNTEMFLQRFGVHI